MRILAVTLYLFLLSHLVRAEELTLENVMPPAANSVDEPLAARFSLDRATRFLDQASLDWIKQRKCFTCHTNYSYLIARPTVSAEGTAHRQVRIALEELVEQRWAESGPRWDAEVVMSAAVLAINDAATSGQLHPTTRQALDRMWSLQREDGGFHWIKCGWPPMESDDDYAVAIAAIAAGAAPDGYAESEAARAGIQKLRDYLRTNPPPTLHHTAMLMWADRYGTQLLTPAQRRAAIEELFALQKSDGGWSLATLGNWERSDGSKQDTHVSDGYGTGFVVFVLRQAGIPADDVRLERGVSWLKKNQRESGRWFSRSLNKDSKHFISHAGTAFAVMAIQACAPPDTDEAGFHPLFNGNDLTGWVLTNTPPATWTVQDGMLICSGKPIGEIRTARMYQNFILELEWRHMVPRGNAGVFIWADDITARGVPFHRSIEVQVLENAYGNTRSHTTHGDIFPIHGATMVPINGRGGSRAFPTEERSKPSPEWNHYRITCQDGEISLAVNGNVVTRGTDCSPRKGYICLESEGGIVHYRNIRIKELPDTPLEDGHVAVADRGYRSIYTGIDLSGWTAAPLVFEAWRVNDWVLSCGGPIGNNDATLVTTEQFGDVGFVFDVRLKDDSKSLQVRIRDATIDSNDPVIAKHLEQPGRWNRFEGVLRGRQLTLHVNGHKAFENREFDELADRGSLSLSPGGPIDFANLYIRELPGAER